MKGINGIAINCSDDGWGIMYNKQLTDLMHRNGKGSNVEYWGELLAVTKRQKEFIRSLAREYDEYYGEDGYELEVIRYGGKNLIRCGCCDCYPSSALPIRHTDVFNQ